MYNYILYKDIFIIALVIIIVTQALTRQLCKYLLHIFRLIKPQESE